MNESAQPVIFYKRWEVCILLYAYMYVRILYLKISLIHLVTLYGEEWVFIVHSCCVLSSGSVPIPVSAYQNLHM